MLGSRSGTVGLAQTAAARTPERCLVSVVIKALNEESGIEATIESALRAVSKVSGEVVLADSCSTDRTVELAMKYPVRIVQLANASERCCGIGPQLGYQHSSGEFIYLIDGDMQLLDASLKRRSTFWRNDQMWRAWADG